MEKVTVLIPVGPNYDPAWLQEAFDSAVNQTYTPDEILLIDDGSALLSETDPLNYPFVPGEHLVQDSIQILSGIIDNDIQSMSIGMDHTYRSSLPIIADWYAPSIMRADSRCFNWYNREKGINYRIWKSPANVGFTAAFNLGMGLATNDLVVYLAADDRLMPTAVEQAVQTYLDNDKKDAWYHLKYIDSNGHVSQIHNNVALTTKTFWHMVGGYPPAAFVGPDAALMSCLMVHAPDRLIPVPSDEPLYWVRDHPNQETKTHTWRFVSEMNSIRNKLTTEFKFKD